MGPFSVATLDGLSGRCSEGQRLSVATVALGTSWDAIFHAVFLFSIPILRRRNMYVMYMRGRCEVRCTRHATHIDALRIEVALRSAMHSCGLPFHPAVGGCDRFCRILFFVHLAGARGLLLRRKSP